MGGRRSDTEAVPPVPQALVRDIIAGNCVAFVGAGFSAAAKVPAWKGLLESLARQTHDPAVEGHVRDLVRRGSGHALDEAAQALEDALGRARFLRELAGALAWPSRTAEMSRRLEWLRGIPFRLILTTNFDGLLDGDVASHAVYREALRASRDRWWSARHTTPQGTGAPVVKLHGDLRHAAGPDCDVVITRLDYRRRLYRDAAYATFVRSMMATTTVLYLGFSFTDPYLNELRSEVLALLAQDRHSAPVAYALVNDAPVPTQKHYRRHEGIELLTYDSRGHKSYSAFDAWLHELHDATNPLLRFGRHLERGRILWVDPHPGNNREAFPFMTRAARLAKRGRDALVRVADAEAGLKALRAGRGGEAFDLVLTHWGDGTARDDQGRSQPTAVRLLTGMRAENLRAPVIVFAGEREANRRRRVALRLGALAYCHRFETLFRKIDEVFAPEADVG